MQVDRCTDMFVGPVSTSKENVRREFPEIVKNSFVEDPGALQSYKFSRQVAARMPRQAPRIFPNNPGSNVTCAITNGRRWPRSTTISSSVQKDRPT